MASRRMFSKDVVCSDRFLDMPASAQALYFQYGLEADDDGFVSAPKGQRRKPSLFMKKIRKQPKNSLGRKLQSILKRHLVKGAVGKFSEHIILAQQDMQNLSIRSQH